MAIGEVRASVNIAAKMMTNANTDRDAPQENEALRRSDLPTSCRHIFAVRSEEKKKKKKKKNIRSTEPRSSRIFACRDNVLGSRTPSR